MQITRVIMSNSVGGCDPVEGSISKKRSSKRSEVWDHFKKTSDGKRAICKYCDESLGAKSKNGTSHLKRHLKSCLQQRQDLDQPLIMGIPNEVRKFGSTSEKTWDVEVKKAILAEIPFAHSECKKALYSLMGIMDMDETICSYYELEKKKLANQFQYLTSRVCFSVEINRMTKTLFYMSITAHFINEDFNLVKILIGFKTFPDDSFGSCEVQIIEKCISDWKFGDKKFSITEDAFLSFDRLRAREEFSPTMLLEGLYSHILSHEQQLALSYSQAVGPVFSEEIANIENFIKAMKAVRCQMDSFNQIAKERDLHPINEDWLNDLNRYDPSMWYFARDLECWKPVVKIFKEAIHYKDVFSQYAKINYGRLAKGHEGCSELELENLGCNGLDTANLSSLCTGKELSTSSMCDIDWERVETAVKIFDKVHEITDRMTSFNYPTSNLYFWNLEEFENLISTKENDQITNENINETQHNHLCYAICDILSFLIMNKVYFVACVLDSRYKLIFLKYYLEKPNRPQPKFGNKEDINEIWEFLQTTFDAYVKGNTNEFANLQEEGCTSNSTHLSFPIDDGFSIYTKESEKNNQKSELEEYLDDKLVKRHDASFNLLGWWKQNRSQYPVLSKMARDVLAIPTCVYSMKGKISSDLRGLEGVSPQLVEAVICSKDWILSDLQSIPESQN